jgi:hypothetical protein
VNERVLDLPGIDDGGLAALAGSPYLCQLRSFRVRGNEITATGVRKVDPIV